MERNLLSIYMSTTCLHLSQLSLVISLIHLEHQRERIIVEMPKPCSEEEKMWGSKLWYPIICMIIFKTGNFHMQHYIILLYIWIYLVKYKLNIIFSCIWDFSMIYSKFKLCPLTLRIQNTCPQTVLLHTIFEENIEGHF